MIEDEPSFNRKGRINSTHDGDERCKSDDEENTHFTRKRVFTQKIGVDLCRFKYWYTDFGDQTWAPQKIFANHK